MVEKKMDHKHWEKHLLEAKERKEIRAKNTKKLGEGAIFAKIQGGERNKKKKREKARKNGALHPPLDCPQRSPTVPS